MPGVDSKAAFVAQLLDLGLVEFTDKFVLAKWDTAANFAYSIPVSPQTGPDEVQFGKLATTILGRPDHEMIHALRRLFFESWTAVSVDMQRTPIHSYTSLLENACGHRPWRVQ